MSSELIAAIAGACVGLIPPIVLGAVGYGRLQARIQNGAEDNSNQWKVITELRNWTSSHEKDSFAVRRELDRDINAVREIALKNDSRWEEVLRRLGTIDEKIGKMEGARPA